KDVCFAIIEGAKEHLKSGGSLQLVARPNKGGKTLAKKMEEVFGNVSVVVKKAGFAVYLSRKN
ncbi:MAG TPA: methyltransferase, partial [Candidatus Nanoarchaeia archaeon]|nr:methyltransferase [Candidatus Nanoarchaeia archaeon]